MKIKEKFRKLLEIIRDIYLLYAVLVLIAITFALTVTYFWVFFPVLLLAIFITFSDRRKKRNDTDK